MPGADPQPDALQSRLPTGRAAEQERLLTTDPNAPLPPACTTAAQVGSRLPLSAQIHRIETRKGKSPGTKTYIKPSLLRTWRQEGMPNSFQGTSGMHAGLGRRPMGRVWGCGPEAPHPGAGCRGSRPRRAVQPFPRGHSLVAGDPAVGNVAPTLQMGKPRSGRPAHFLGPILGKETRSGPGGRERAWAEQGAGGRPQRPGLPESSHESVFAESFRIRPRPTLPLAPTLSETRRPHSGGAEGRVS